MNRYLMLITGIIIAAHIGTAATWYVSPDGNDGNNGSSWALAKKTIQAGVDIAASGDTVWVTNGTYVLTNQVCITNEITVKSVNGASSTIVNGNYPVTTNRCFYLSHANVLDGFTITNGYTASSGGGVNNNGVVQNCTISGNTAANGGGVENYGGMVQNCTISGNGVGVGIGGGVLNDHDGTMQNCTVLGNTAANGGGVYNNWGTVQNCTVLGNTATTGGGVANGGTVQNCIVYYNENGDIYRLSGNTYYVLYSCASGLSGNGNITNEPCFYDIGSGYGTNHTGGNFRLQAISPCINTGTNQTWMANTNDVEGNPRICLGTVDMGAYEYNPCFVSDGSSVDHAAISWNSIFLASGYRIYRNASNYFTSASSVGSTAETNYNDTTAVAGTTYWYWSQATNSSGVIVLTSPNYGYRAIPGAPLHPSYITASQSSYSNKVLISWSSAAGANGYTVWRANADDFSQSSCLNASGTADTNYDDTASTPGAQHYYWVRSTNASGSSGFSDPSQTGIRGLTPPTSISATDGTYAWVWITWAESTGATSYEVWRNTQPISSAATNIGSSSITNFADPRVSAGQTYYYWVKPKSAYTTGAFSGNNSGSYQSWSATVSAGTYQDRTRILWNAVEGANAYEVWRSANSSIASAVMVTNNLSDTEYSDYGGTFGVLYYYWARATNSMTNCYSSSGSGYRGALPPTGISASKGTYHDSVLVSWSASVNATGYEIYRSEGSDPAGSTYAGESATTSFNDTDVTMDAGYYFWVKAKNVSGASPFSSSDTGWSSSSAGLPSVPTGVSASDGTYTNKVLITWSTASGATSYQIFRFTSNNSAGADQIGTATSTTHDDTGAVAGTTYYYWVKSTNSAGASGFSSYDTGWRSIAPVITANPQSQTNNIGESVSFNVTATGSAPLIYQWQKEAVNITSANSATYTINPVAASHAGNYRCLVNNMLGVVTSAVATLTVNDAPTVPVAPTGVSASDGTYTNKVLITWNAASGATSYQIFRFTSNNSAGADQIGTSASTAFDDTGAVAGTTYYYWVKAVNAVGASGFSSYDTGSRAAVSSAISAPDNIQASDGTFTDKVRVSWNSVSVATSYQVWKNTTNDSSSASNLTTTSSTTYDDTSATTAGLTLYYWVKAKNDSGVSVFSQPDAGYCGASGASGVADLSLRGFLFQPAVLTNNAHPEVVMLVPVNNGPDNLASSGIGFDFFLSGNTVFGDGDDEWIGDYATTVSINAGAFASVIVSDAGLNGITIPPTASGAYYVFAKVKHTSAILDPNMTNNTAMRSGAIIVGAGAGAKEPVAGDFDGDGKADPCVYQESTGNWYIKLSGGGYGLIQVTGFGGEGWKPRSGDYDGDGKSDLAVYQESTGNWQIKLSASGYSGWTTSLGGLGYLPVSGDFNGGGHSDLAVYREASGYWYFIYMETEAPAVVKFGQDGYVPVTGDYTGDGVTDLALYQESTGSWFLKLGDLVYALTGFGGDGWKPVGGDYDGDGLEDLMLYQASTGNWMIRLSGSGYAIVTLEGFGGPDYVPVSGDYDGDGKADLVLYNSATATWLIRLSSASYFQVSTTF